MIQRAACVLFFVLVVLVSGAERSAKEARWFWDVQFLSENLVAGNFLNADGHGSVFTYQISEKKLDVYPFPVNGPATFVKGSTEEFAAWESIDKQHDTWTLDYWFSQGSIGSIAAATELRDIQPGNTLVVSLLPDRRYLQAIQNEEGGYDYRVVGRDHVPLTETVTLSAEGVAHYPVASAVISYEDREFLVIVERELGKDLCIVRLYSLPSLTEMDSQAIAGLPLQLVSAGSNKSLFLLLRGKRTLLSVAVRNPSESPQLHIQTWIHDLPFGGNTRLVSTTVFVVATGATRELFAFPIEMPLEEADTVEGTIWDCLPQTDSGGILLSPGGSKLVAWEGSEPILRIFDIRYPTCVPLAGVNIAERQVYTD